MDQIRQNEDIKAKFKASIAVRIAYSFFAAHKPNITFAIFRASFKKAITKLDDKPVRNVLEMVLLGVQHCLDVAQPHKNNILFIVDEPAKTNIPKEVRNMIYYTWLAEHCDARMVISSLRPGDLGKDITGITPYWVQLSSYCLSAHELSKVIDSIAKASEQQWLSKLFDTKEGHKPRLFTAYLLNTVGSNWRAVVCVCALVAEPPQDHLDEVNAVLDSTKGVSVAVKGISGYFPKAKTCNQAISEIMLNAVIRRRIDLNDQKHLFGTQSAQACLLSGLLSNRVPNPDSGEALEVPQLAMAIVHNWLRHNFQSRNDPATLVQKKKWMRKMLKLQNGERKSWSTW